MKILTAGIDGVIGAHLKLRLLDEVVKLNSIRPQTPSMSKALFRALVVRMVESGGGMRRELMRSGLGSLAIKAGYVALQLSVSIVLARTLGPAGFGAYAFVLALVTLLLLPSQLGFSGLLVRMTAVYQAQDQYALLRGLFARSAQIVGLASLLLAGIGVVVVTAIDVVPAEIATGPLLAGFFLLPFLAMLTINGSALQGLGHVLVGQIPDQILRPLFLLGFVLLVHWHMPLTVESVIISNIIATALTLVISQYVLSKKKPTALTSIQSDYKALEWTRAALPFLLLGGTQVINNQTDIIMLSILTNQEQTGLYRVALQMADGLGMILVAIAAVITPHLARLHAEQNWDVIQSVLVTSHRAGVAMLLPIAAIMAVSAVPLLRVIFGPEYSGSATTLIIMVLGKTLYAAVGFSGIALSMFGLASIAAVITALTATLNVLLNLVLIPLMGIEGAALGTAVSAITVAFGGVVWMHRYYGLDFSMIGSKKRKPIDA